ncbi:hypothetical protein [Lentzea sp.]|uniref:DUF2017 family protein n=1 Tax=Lentzea sp. TaxID=56099 RepID=UPI002B7D6AA4|nr:hypothetical protein [Lentzea sp.]HUQ60240.1 hypothetical protein [Lentzea sp.]
MIGWDRCGDSDYVAVLNRHEIDVLNSYITGLAALLDRRADSYEPVTTVAGATVPMPVASSDDARIIRILQTELGEHEPEWVLTFGEERCFREVSAALRTMGSTLPTADGVVVLRSRHELAAWSCSIRCFLTTIVVVADQDGNVKGKPSAATIDWLHDLAEQIARVEAVATLSS